MYRAILSGNVATPATFFDDQDIGAEHTTALTAAKLTQELSKAGNFTFTMQPTHPYIDSFEKYTSFVDLYRNDDIIFTGRVYQQKKDIHSQVTITCEGLLSLFNDSVFRPATYECSITALVQAMLDSHNSQVDDSRKVYLGTITVNDEYLYRAYEDYKKTYERLQNLAGDYGAYLEVYRSPIDSKFYLNVLQEYTYENSQTIDFGQNLISINQDSKTTNMISVIVPLGAQVENEDGSRTRLTIKAVNEGKDYIENPRAIAEFGRVYGIVTWDDVTIPANLYAKAEAYLDDMSRSRVSITVSAVDMAKAGSQIEAWKLGDVVMVNAAAVGINKEKFTIMKYSLDLLNPVNNKIGFGSDIVGYVSGTQRQQDRYSEIVEELISDYTVNQTLEDLKKMIGDNSGGITELQQLIASLRSEISQTSDAITLSVSETISDLETRVVQAMTSAVMELTKDQWQVLFEQAGYGAWLRFNEDGYLIIGRSDNPIQSIQDGSSYAFYDTSTGQTVLEMNEEGATMPSVNVSEQLRFTSGSLGQWVIRKGEAHGLGYNLDDVWIGG